MAETKICVGCNIDKPKSDYHKLNTSGSGVQSRCKVCTSAYKKKRYWNNHEVELAKMTKSRLKPENVVQRKGYYENKKSEYQDRYKKYMSDEEKKAHKNKINRELYHKTKHILKEQKKAYRQTEEYKQRIKDTHNLRKQTDIEYVLKRRLRFRVRHAITAIQNGKFKNKSTLELLGCDLTFFKKYIEDKFCDGMSWERMSEIHIDHIKPCAKFDLTKEEEQKKCFHYTNLQPLWAVDNHIKNAKYEEVCQNQ